MTPKFKLEICVDSLESLENAIAGGADRIELCSALELGGLTPSYGLMLASRKLLDGLDPGLKRPEIFVMLRPRAGDFIYSDQEYQSLLGDLEVVRSFAFDGVVTGFLTPQGGIDLDRLADFMEHAGDLDVALHRAFDAAKHPQSYMQELIDLGLVRILTSGGAPTALEGADLICELQQEYGDLIEIMPGAGIRASNIRDLHQAVACQSYHGSCRKLRPRQVEDPEYIGRLGLDPSCEDLYFADQTEVAKLKTELEKLANGK